MTLSPWLGAAGIVILCHIRSPLLTLIFNKCSFFPQTIRDWNALPDSFRPLAIGMHFQTLLSPPLKVPRMVLLNSLLWWELGTNLPGHGPGKWLSFWCVTSKQFWFRLRLGENKDIFHWEWDLLSAPVTHGLAVLSPNRWVTIYVSSYTELINSEHPLRWGVYS